MKILSSILFFIVIFLDSFAQDRNPVFFEKSGENLVRFYFDSNYYLVDRDCEFKSIERVASFDPASSKYVGSFTDFDLDGRPILEGSYVDGKKSGYFKAYHPNRSIKWETTFVDDRPQGNWNYYYPDGELMMVVEFASDYVKIREFIDTRGRKVVDEGNGRFEFNVPFQGYNPYGYPFVKHKGKLRDGVPDGIWQIYYTADKLSDLVAEEAYYRGVFKSGYDIINETEYSSPIFSLLPVENFLRAEKFISKACNYDEIAGYNSYLADFLTQPFNSFELRSPIEDNFEYKIQVSKDGNPSKLEIIDDVPEEISRPFRMVLNSVERYIPSFANGEYIEDEITVKGKISSDESGKIQFHSLNIARKNEP